MSTGSDIDWDGLGTFALTLLVGILTAGLPFIVSGIRVLSRGLRAPEVPGSDLLVVFGKRLLDGQPDADYRARLRTAARFAAGRPAHRVWILGGRTGNARQSEAAAGAAWLREQLDPRALSIGLEEHSVDTLTNLRNLRTLLAHTDSRPLTLITNRYHLARVDQMATSLGLPHRCCAAEDIASALRPTVLPRWPMEAFYVAWFATGKRFAQLTRNRRMLERVT